jgi:hypothetical protein
MERTMKDDERMARLLAGANRPSPLERDARFERVWTRVQPRRRRSWAIAMSLAGTTAALLLFVRVHVRDEFTARGASAVGLRAFCAGECRAGGKLFFEAHGLAAPAYVAAYARRPDGTILWYLPAAAEPERRIEHDGLLPDGAILGAEHTPGRYELITVVSTRPLDRAHARTATVGGEIRAIDHATIDVR